MKQNLINRFVRSAMLLILLGGVLSVASFAQVTTAARADDGNSGSSSSKTPPKTTNNPRPTSPSNSAENKQREILERGRRQTEAVNNAAEGILNIFRERSERRNAEEAEEREAREREEAERERRNVEAAAEERERARRRAEFDPEDEAEEDERAKERERLYREQQKKKAAAQKPPANAETPIVSVPSAPKLVSGTAPAFPSSYGGDDSWTAWYAMKDKNGINLIDLDVAYWAGGGKLPSGVRDFPMMFAVRNRTDKNLTLYYEVFVQSVQNNPSGWLRFQHTIPAGKHIFGKKLQAWSVSNARVLRVELAAEENTNPPKK